MKYQLTKGDLIRKPNKVLLAAIAICLIAYWGGRVIRLQSEVKKQKQTIEHYQGVEQKQKEELEILLKEKQKLENEKAELQKQVQAKSVRIASVKKVADSVEQYRPLCQKYFPEQVNNCLLVMKAESGGNARAYSRTHDAGLMQINVPTWSRFFGLTAEQLFDPETNIKCARVIYNRSGSWRPWVAARKLGLA